MLLDVLDHHEGVSALCHSSTLEQGGSDTRAPGGLYLFVTESSAAAHSAARCEKALS
ncbi:hypothetical protein FM104_16170 [Microbacterium esteraromaticum]|uniref:Uncharacterized protein n=1 Tax=Microbacterium esteraromaticum TaxID=57043 RepID=A0A1R4KTY3_9MICO|nr:hypothetical protein FM104_16170 [Microbacterium esteraromaticum]